MRVVASVLFATASHAAAEPLDRDWLDASVDRALSAFDVPGVAVAVVADGEVLVADGFGRREVGRPPRVDRRTLFQIGSISKGFTAAARGLLVESGDLDWDDRVIDHLPAFRLNDPYVTREMTVKDLLVHNSGLGLGAGDLLFWPNAESSRADVLAGLRHLEPVQSFRAGFVYNNLMYVVAAEVIEAVSGSSWERFVEDRLFAPAGMRDCAASYERSLDRNNNRDNHATPHMIVDGELVPTFFSPGAVLSSAGAVNCSARDLATWMAVLLADGRLADGETLIEPETVQTLWQPANLLLPDELLAEHGGSRFRHYGLGWFVSEYKDDWLVEHGGTIHGASARIVLVPDRGFGVVVLANQWTPITRALARAIVERQLYGGEVDWLELHIDAFEARAVEAAAAAPSGAPAEAAECRPIVDAGATARFRDAWYGDITVTREDDAALAIDLERTPSLTGPLECVRGDLYVARWADRTLGADAYVQFDRDVDGSVDGMRLEWVDPATDFSYDFHTLRPRFVGIDPAP